MCALTEQPNTIQHWQLRDLIACENVPNEVYYVYYNKTIKYDTDKGEGQLDICTLSDRNSIYSASVGESVNNALHIGSCRSGETCLLVSNNDSTIKVFNVNGMLKRETIHFPVAINYAAVSADGQYMACVGDSENVYLYSDSSSGGYHHVATYAAANESGMCCAWNASGTAFASASQDGTICVWEVRMGKLLAKLKTESGRASRVVKFSTGGIDLLLYSEHDSQCHVVDARTFDTEQVIDLLRSDLSTRDISGASFAADGSRVYVGIAEHGIVEFEVNTLGRRSFSSGSLI
eukprot:gene22841-27606_t